MSRNRTTNSKSEHVAAVVGATSKWQSDGRNTLPAHDKTLDESDLPVKPTLGHRGRHLAEVCPGEVLRRADNHNKANASALARAIQEQGDDCMFVELDLVSQSSITTAFAMIRDEVATRMS
jgi:hypothetical protein